MEQNEPAIHERPREDPRVHLYLAQKELLDTFLEKGAITQAQYDKSFGDLTEKMGMQDYLSLK